MAVLVLDRDADRLAGGTTQTVTPTLAGRLTAFCANLWQARSGRPELRIDGDLAVLNDETLLDLGLDPASVRQARIDPLMRYIF